MRVTARLTYGLDALVELAAASRPVKGQALAARHGLSVGFLENIMADLRRAGLVQSKRGAQGGYWLARPAEDTSVADVIRILDGAGRVESPTRSGDLLPVWRTITDATMAAAASFTLASMVAGRTAAQRPR
jgi:Rrf2 family protein